MFYDLYCLMKNKANNKEMIEELTELYEDKVKEIKEYKKHYHESESEMNKLKEIYFVEKMYCVNPDAPIIDRVSTTIKSFEPISIKGVQDYMHSDMICRLYTEKIMNCIKIARDIGYILNDLGIIMDKTELEKIFE